MSSIFLKNASDEVRHFIDKVEVLIKGTRFEGKVYVVGGAVRNSLLGLPIEDIDIAVEMEDGGITFANWLAAKDKSYVIGKNPIVFERYGTAKVSLRNDKNCMDLEVECVQTRKEKYDMGSRNPKVAFGTIKEDALRRDLTVNALYYNISSKEIIDVLGTSFGDMEKQILRTPLNADETFSEDPLRMLRAIRFSTKMGWGIEKDTWLGIVKNCDKIKTISQERITDEFSKILLCNKPSEGIIKLRYSGLLEEIAKDVYDEKDNTESIIYKVSYFDHTMKVLDDTLPILEHRLAALFHDIGCGVECKDKNYKDTFSAEIAKTDLMLMKYPNKVIESVMNGIKYHNYFRDTKNGDIPSDKNIRKFVNKCGADLSLVLDVMNANCKNVTIAPKKRLVTDLLNKIEELDKKEDIMSVRLPIDGKDIINEFNLKSSPLIGKLLDTVREAYFENPKMIKKDCFDIIKLELAKIV